MLRVFVVLLVCAAVVSATWMVPGSSRREYAAGENITLKVNKLTSQRTQLPYGFYSLPFCQPAKMGVAHESLGEVLLGDKLQYSAYSVQALINKECEVVCTKQYKASQVRRFVERIREEYRGHWALDHLPVATETRWQVETASNAREMIEVFEEGFPLGQVTKDDEVLLNNHVTLRILYNSDSGVSQQEQDQQNLEGLSSTLDGRDATDGRVAVVGFFIETRDPEGGPLPLSIKHEPVSNADEKPSTCFVAGPPPLVLAKGDKLVLGNDELLTVVWTYSVHWEKSDIRWSNRWDLYTQMTDPDIHWFSIINSGMIVLFLTGMVAMILVRTLRADLRRYNIPIDRDEDVQEETGWKLVHGDVFRPPKYRMLLSVFVGTGVQVALMCMITLIFSVLGFLSPENRGSLLSTVPVLFVLMGVFAGYYSAHVYKMMGGTEWKRNTLLTAFMLPGLAFVLIMILNFFLVGEHSTAGFGPGPFFALLALWFLVSVPLVLLGSYFGFRKPVPEWPVRTNLIPRLIPDAEWYMSPVALALLGGVLPFGVVFIELFFLLSSIWMHQFYFLFGFLFLVLSLMVVTSGEISIVMTYFRLCSENYHWWWMSFFASGTSALYFFLYALFYMVTRLHIVGFVSMLLYVGYSLLLSMVFFLITGSIGFLASLQFVRKIYASVHLA